MDKTPRTRSTKLSCIRNKKNSTSSTETNETMVVPSQLGASICSTSTPIIQRMPESDIEESPSYYPCTQEEFENLEVGWDWNSPQGKQKKRRKQKRLILNQSPKLPLRKHPSNNQIKNLEKLKEELKALRQEISVPDNEACLVLSPLEEIEFKKSPRDYNNESAIESLIQENQMVCDSELEDLFNDSADEDLCLFSQQLENNLNTQQFTTKSVQTPVKQTINNNNINSVKRVLNLENGKSYKKNDSSNNFADDSFDVVMQDIEDDKIAELTQVFNESQVVHIKTEKRINSFQRTKSDVQYDSRSSINLGKMEFQRTQSFELANAVKIESSLPKSTQEEIERKRQQALAKLQAKRRQDSNESLHSPIKCSPEEIEQKRRQALAKLEAKKQQEIIEKKRQEALRKLEMKRKNNIIKTSLCK